MENGTHHRYRTCEGSPWARWCSGSRSPAGSRRAPLARSGEGPPADTTLRRHGEQRSGWQNARCSNKRANSSHCPNGSLRSKSALSSPGCGVLVRNLLGTLPILSPHPSTPNGSRLAWEVFQLQRASSLGTKPWTKPWTARHSRFSQWSPLYRSSHWQVQVSRSRVPPL